MLCEELKKKAHRNTTIFFGAATSSSARGCGLEDFRRTGFRVVVTTDDGSLGEHGLVTRPFEQALKETGGTGVTVYACGPWPMMRRVAELSREFEAVCYASLEAPMGCGFGVCVGCVVAVQTHGAPGYGSYQRVCLDGAIFRSEKIRWEIDAMGH
jgi:dihydroorotate dehydrogenase electron transfer subunit